MFKCIRYNSYREFIFSDVENGQADTVQADGPFFNDQGAERSGEPEPELPAAIQFFTTNAGACSVYMALNDMAIEAAVHDHTAFQVYQVACLPVTEIAFLQGF